MSKEEMIKELISVMQTKIIHTALYIGYPI